MSATTPNPFQSMRSFVRAPRKVMIHHDSDILDTITEWHPHQLALPENQRGEPKSVRLEVRPGAVGHEISIVPLSHADAAAADAIVDALQPPRVPLYEDGKESGPSSADAAPKKPVEMVYDTSDLDYQAAVQPLYARRTAFVVLKGVVDLEAATPGDTQDAKIDSVLASMPMPLLRYLSSLILTSSFGAGDLADFFTKGGSDATKSSPASPAKSRPAGKRK